MAMNGHGWAHDSMMLTSDCKALSFFFAGHQHPCNTKSARQPSAATPLIESLRQAVLRLRSGTRKRPAKLVQVANKFP